MKENNNLKWLYLDFNSYFATIEQQVKPILRKKPVVIVPSVTDYTCAIAASHEAKKLGIKTGTMIYKARSICPDLICVQADHEKYIYYHHKLVKEISKYIPIEQVCSIDEVACKLLGKECNPKIIVNKAIDIKKGIRKNVGDYISCSIGVSTNKFLAKTASNLQKPDGLKIINSNKILQRINHLNLSDLTGIGKRMEVRLLLSGITSIKKLYELSPKNMRKIWGNVLGEKFWYMLRGKDLEEDAYVKTKTIGHSHVLHPDWRDLKKSREIMRRLVLKAASRLRRKSFLCTRLKISIKTVTGKKFKSIEKFQKLNDSFSLLEKANNIWIRLIRYYKIAKIMQVNVVLYDLYSMDTKQLSLLDGIKSKNRQDEKKKKLVSKAMDSINSRFGRDSVTIGALPNDVVRFSGTKIAFTRIPEIKEFYE